MKQMNANFALIVTRQGHYSQIPALPCLPFVVVFPLIVYLHHEVGVGHLSWLMAAVKLPKFGVKAVFPAATSSPARDSGNQPLMDPRETRRKVREPSRGESLNLK